MARPQLKDQMEEAVHILLSHPEISEVERYRGGFRIKRKDTNQSSEKPSQSLPIKL